MSPCVIMMSTVADLAHSFGHTLLHAVLGIDMDQRLSL